MRVSQQLLCWGKMQGVMSKGFMSQGSILCIYASRESILAQALGNGCRLERLGLSGLAVSAW